MLRLCCVDVSLTFRFVQRLCRVVVSINVCVVLTFRSTFRYAFVMRLCCVVVSFRVRFVQRLCFIDASFVKRSLRLRYTFVSRTFVVGVLFVQRSLRLRYTFDSLTFCADVAFLQRLLHVRSTTVPRLLREHSTQFTFVQRSFTVRCE